MGKVHRRSGTGQRGGLNQMKAEKAWVRWKAAVAAMEQGRVIYAISELEELRRFPKRLGEELSRQVDFSLAVALLIVNRSHQAIEILLELLRKCDAGERYVDPIAVKVELSNAYVQAGMWDAAHAEADQAIKLSEAAGRVSPIAYQNRGFAKRAIGNWAGAIADFLHMVRICSELGNREQAAIGAEQIGRTHLALGEFEKARHWANLAQTGYRACATHHLRTFVDLQKKLDAAYAIEAPETWMPEEAKLLARLLRYSTSTVGTDALDVLDIDLYLFLSAIMAPHGTVHIRIPLQIPNYPVPKRLQRLLEADIETIRPHQCYPDFVAHSFLASRLRVNHDLLPNPNGAAEGTFAQLPPESPEYSITTFYWEAPSPWPWGFGAILHSLSLLYCAAGGHLSERTRLLRGVIPEVPSFIFLPLTVRTWPRSIQARYLSLGEFETGATVCPSHLIEDFVRVNLLDRSLNLQDFQAMGYTSLEAEQLEDGGLIALLATRIGPATGAAPISLGGLPLNEVNIANLPRSHLPPPIEQLRPGFVVDRYYQGWFFALAPTPGDHGWYGINNELFRDHFDTFRDGLDIVGSVRAKHYAIPIVEANDVNHLREICGRLTEFDGTHAWYRGQTRAYTFRRPPLVARALFGRDDIVEPSLLGAAPRRGLNYEDVHSALQLLVQDYIYQRADEDKRDLEGVHRLWFQKAAWGAGIWDIGVMALAQHYGIPTHGLDITSSLDVALWFATQRFQMDDSGRGTYTQMKSGDWPNDPERWPVIYIILPVANSLKPSIWRIDVLEELGLQALRPQRQSAAFFMGAHGIHQNRMAEALACIVRLRPGHWESGMTYKELFPPPEDDRAYAFMLGIKQRHKNGPLGRFFNEIIEYSYDAGS